MSSLTATPATQLVSAAPAQAVLRRHNVHVLGSGATTLLFCNGFNCGQSVWNAVAPLLADRYRLVLFDQVGVGDANNVKPDPQQYSTTDGYVQDVLDICEALGLHQAVIVGHSAGAIVGLLAAVQAPQYFARAVLLATSPRYLNAPGYYGGFEARDMIDLLAEMQHNYQAWANTFATMMIGQYDAPALSHELVDCASKADPELAKNMVRLVFMGDYRAEFAQLHQPTLLLQCTDDPAVPDEVNQYLLAHLPCATLRVLPTTGHCPHLTAPQEVAAAIRQFVG